MSKISTGQFANFLQGLQTPRLKRLAEIVSAQAIAQQEKLEYPSHQYDSVSEEHELADSELNGV
jgi:myosin-5